MADPATQATNRHGAAETTSPPTAPPAAENNPSPGVATDSVTGPVPIEVGDGDSTYGSIISDEAISAYNLSLSSSVVDYPHEYGRRYHAFRPGAYFLPNDELEMERMDMAHVLMVRAIGNRLFLAPLEEAKIHRILDIGTGTGIWSMEMADIFPNAEVVGIDLSPIQPSWVPSNVKFEVDDIESPWINNLKYDYIFSRYMLVSISDWPRLVNNTYNNLNPGGWVEFQDVNCVYYSDDGSLTKDHATHHWNKKYIVTCEKMGRTACPGPRLEGWVKDAGFQNVTHQSFKIPIGPWAKEPYYSDLGMLNLVQLLDGLEGFTLKLFCGYLGQTREEVLALLSKVQEELKSNTFHAMFDYHVVYAQRPFVEKEA